MGERSGAAWTIARRLRRSPLVYRAARRAYTSVNHRRRPVRLPGIPGPVHRNDLMVDRSSATSRAAYVATGRQVVDLLAEALAAVGRPLGEADVLDFGCGHGRVIRHLAPVARSVAACDLDAECVRFCASAFAATPVVGHLDLSAVALAHYDAIWLGSVITHHPPEATAELLTALAGHVRPGGVLVASSGDRSTLDGDLDSSGREWMAPHVDRLRRELAEVGATYVAYPQVTDGTYGLGYQSSDWLDTAVAAVGLVPVWHRSADWGVQATNAWRRPPTRTGGRSTSEMT